MTKSFKPLLAATCEDISQLRYPVLASPKLDGIRCVIRDGQALSRKLKPIPNDFVRAQLQGLPDGLDGELMLRDLSRPFNEVSSAIMSKAGEPDFVFMAFDIEDGVTHNFEDRIAWIHTLDKLSERLVPVPHTLCTNEEELRALVDQHLAEGYEGTMVRDPNGIYKFGRSTVKEGILLKIKPFVDEEATVVGVVEQFANTNEATLDNLGHTKRSTAKAGKVGKGVLGALQCCTEDGAEFEVGSGFTDAERRELWQQHTTDVDGTQTGDVVGRVVKFKHQPPPGGRKPGEAPRFPVFLGWRED